MQQRTLYERMQHKNLEGYLSAYLQAEYRLAPQAARTLCADFLILPLCQSPAKAINSNNR